MANEKNRPQRNRLPAESHPEQRQQDSNRNRPSDEKKCIQQLVQPSFHVAHAFAKVLHFALKPPEAVRNPFLLIGFIRHL